MSPLVRVAPAKLNLTLEVTGRRPDGYHEIRSIATVISLADTLTAEPGCGFHVSHEAGYDASGMALAHGELNTVEHAQMLVRQQLGRGHAAVRASASEISIALHKRIPASAGLGGGSSDGATALLLLNEALNARLDAETLHAMAAQIGSDCPLFLRGGVQLMSGRGEILQPLPPPVQAWFCILTPRIHRPRKTAALYSLLQAADYRDGSRTAALQARLQQHPPATLSPDDLQNVFDIYAEQAFGSLDESRAALRVTGAQATHLCGSGPSLYGLYGSRSEAEAAESILRADGYAAWAVCTPE